MKYDLVELWNQKGRIVFYRGKDYKLGFAGVVGYDSNCLNIPNWGAELYPLSKIPVKEIVDISEVFLPPKHFIRLAREKEIK